MEARFAYRLIQDIWPSLGGRIQENGWPFAWLPKHTLEASYVSLPAVEYCGSYGCIVFTSDPSIVFKLTTDWSEAYVANVIFKYLPEVYELEPHPNIIRYFGIYEVPGKLYMNRKIFALWREECPCIGWPMWPKCLFEEATGLPQATLVCPRGDSCKAVGVHQFNAAVKAAVTGLNMTARDLSRYRAVADRAAQGAFYTKESGLVGDADSWWHWLLEQYLKAPEMRAKAESSPGWKPADQRDELSFLLGSVLYMTDELGQTMFGQGLADLFRWCWGQQIMLGDVHWNNVGVVYAGHDIVAAPKRFAAARGTGYLAGLEPRLVVTDPGHTLLMDPVYKDVKPEPL